MAATVEAASSDGVLRVDALQPVFQSLYARRFRADIFSFEKIRVQLRVIVADRAGRVIFGSRGRSVGDDFSRWNDVRRALGVRKARAPRPTSKAAPRPR
jgi:two-component system sensor histidine kinase CreC